MPGTGPTDAHGRGGKCVVRHAGLLQVMCYVEIQEVNGVMRRSCPGARAAYLPRWGCWINMPEATGRPPRPWRSYQIDYKQINHNQA